MCRYWSELLPDSILLVAYGGAEDEFEQLKWDNKVFINDKSLRTQDHQRECQSYAGVYRSVIRSISGLDIDRIYFTEFDQIPLQSNFFELLEYERVESRADTLMYGLTHVGDTGHAHYLYHSSKPSFFDQIENYSVRTDKKVVLSAFGFGQYWIRDAFEQMAMLDDKVGCYLEIWAPTIAHHLGYRVKGMRDPHNCNQYFGDFTGKLEEFKKRGCLCIHPVKDNWDQDDIV